MSKVDRSRANIWRGRFQFTPFRPTGEGVPLSSCELADDEELLVFSRGGQERALLMKQMSYHHLCQGELAGEPYLVAF